MIDRIGSRDYETLLQPQPGPEIAWVESFEAELAELTAPFSADDQARLVEAFGLQAGASVANPATMGLPASLQVFLRWARGRDFVNRERQWSPIFTPRLIREYAIEYALPAAHPTKLPIGMDGGGCFYLVDLATETLATYLVDPSDPISCCGLLASSLGEALADGRSQIVVAFRP